jgi:hypothetical protein
MSWIVDVNVGARIYIYVYSRRPGEEKIKILVDTGRIVCSYVIIVFIYMGPLVTDNPIGLAIPGIDETASTCWSYMQVHSKTKKATLVSHEVGPLTCLKSQGPTVPPPQVHFR